MAIPRMRYMFRILALGEENLSIPFIVNSGAQFDEDSTELMEGGAYIYDIELKIGNDNCNLELLVPRSDTIDYDEVIPTVDGILYYLDPSDEGAFELFKMDIDIVEETGRYIPTVAVFIKRDYFLPIPWNTILESFWREFPKFEAIVYSFGSKKSTLLPIETLSEAMVKTWVPMNAETAWVRFPTFVNLTNEYLESGNLELASTCAAITYSLARHLDLGDLYIYAERAAYLYSKMGDFLKASKIMADVDPRMSERFRSIYVDDLIRKADSTFKKKMYKAAAKQYEHAATWAKIELGLDGLEYTSKAYERAVESWVSACEFDQGLRILGELNHEKKHEILERITPRIAAAVDYLISIGKLDVAKIQLYLVIDAYQKEGKFKQLKVISTKIREVLSHILHVQIELKERGPGSMTLDEIENISETFELEPIDLDGDIVKLADLFIEASDFQKVDELLPKIKSPEWKKEVTEARNQREEQLETLRKEAVQQDLERGSQRLSEFIEYERAEFEGVLANALEEASTVAGESGPLEAGEFLEKYGNFFLKLLLVELAESFLGASMEYYLKGLEFERVFRVLGRITPSSRETLLTKMEPLIKESAESLFESRGLKAALETLDGFNKFFRNLLLYENSRSLANLQIEFLKRSALKSIEEYTASESPERAVELALTYMRQANSVSEAYLDGEDIYDDLVYKKVARTFIDMGDLVNAEATLQKIQDKKTYTKLHERILKIESEKSGAKTRVAQQKLEDGITQEQITLLKNRAREAGMTKRADFKKRVALKRRYYLRALESLEGRKFGDALKEYTHSMKQLIRRKLFTEAGLCLLVGALSELSSGGSMDKVKNLLDETAEELGTGASIFKETLPVRLCEFIVAMDEQGQEALRNEALKLVDNLPLFQVELTLVNDLAGTRFKALGESEVLAPRTGEVGTERRAETGARAGVVAGTPATDEREGEAKRRLQAQELKLHLEQKFAMFRQQTRDIKITSNELLQSRLGLKRAFFKGVTQALEREDFKGAATQYREAVAKLNRRKDLSGVGVALALGVVSLIHAGGSTGECREFLDATMKDLGMNEKVVKSTFHVDLVRALLDAKDISDKPHLAQGWKLLELFPLFEEEKKLLERPKSFS
ncbi:MAG: hypothetical protein ACTSU5_00180 [Promethearchaeota archaeon]